jgi:hypothetical protein
MNVKVTVEHNGKSWSAETMRIRSTQLGMEDHGIWTAYLHCEGAGTGVGVGGYCLDEKPIEIGGTRRRVGSAYGLDWLMQVCSIVGVRNWEDLRGIAIYVLYDSDSHWGQSPQGIANIDTGKALIFKDHANQWRELTSEVIS